ncbi:GrpB family protein [Ohtaekwangia koreensis]|uniref:GrpB domain, predicted nucleotidyltransferase, UPF0157 family n=1 Tax=Ohtaekwangia koreensis TaxID=688867 RepID=A0A1T5KJM4_9BACT|nr:GrpB family protein [Ohtaekwangia koreensis]SKC63659.1 GrpB domain, predicted nucleotidyltransferase, UPF0157 family [Ohtaekwangia koreensis]
MNKTLYDLTKEDWNSLFPVKLVEHNPEWRTIYTKEKEKIIKKLGAEIILRIEHFGSTSIQNIKAKPYIDILIQVSSDHLFSEEIIAKLKEIGYTYFKVPERDNISAYMSFGKGYNLNGVKEQIFHIHMCPKDNVMCKQTDFRDYLNSNFERAKQYEALKLELESKYKNDRGAYVLGKTDFINETIKMVK